MRMTVNAANIVKALTKQNNPFLKSHMFNKVTFAVTPKKACNNTEKRDELGRQALEKFITMRMVDKMSMSEKAITVYQARETTSC